MFIPLPVAFRIPGHLNRDHIERYYREEVHDIHSGRYRIVICTNNHLYTAAFEGKEDRDQIWRQLDRYLTGKDRLPMYDYMEE